MNLRGCLCLLLMSLPLWAAGQVDQRELDLRAAYPTTLRWDNVEVAWPWLDGVVPGYRRAAGMHVVRLAPGQQTHLQLPAGAWLRLLAQGRDAAGVDAPQVLAANGSGLYLRLPAERRAAGDWLLRPASDEVLDILISNPAATGRAVELALFVSRWVRPPELAPYRHPVRFQMPPLGLRLAGQVSVDKVWALGHEQTLQAEVIGPARYRLETRLDYRQAGSVALQDYRLGIWLDARPLRELAFDSAPEVRHVVLIDGRPTPVGQRQQGHIDIPAGRHRLRLRGATPMFLRLLRSAQPDYLLPGLNQPAGLAAWRPRQTAAGMDMALPELERILTAGGDIGAIEAATKRLASDNRHQDGGLLAAMALRRLVRRHPQRPGLAVLARSTLLRHSYYQDLIPERGMAGERMEFYHRSLREPQDQRDHYVADPRQLAARQRGHQQAYFVTLGDTRKLEYRLPARQTPSMLRIAVSGAVATPQGLSLVFDDGTRWRLSLRPPEQDPQRLRVDAAQAWSGLHTGLQDGQTAVEAGVWEIPLPAGVRRIRILRQQGQGTPLRLALQYRRARPWRMADADYLAALRDPAASRLFRDALFQVDALLDPDPAGLRQLARASGMDRQRAWDLLNHWTPLLRWLRRQREQYAASVDPGGFVRPAHPLRVPDQLRLRAQAQADVAAGQWLSALEDWRQLVSSQDSGLAREARLGMADALLQQGEPRLAERLWRSAYLYADDPALRDAAYARLRAFYQDQGDAAGLAGVTITQLLRAPREGEMRLLPEILSDTGLPDMALDVALMLPDQGPERVTGSTSAPLSETELELALAGRHWAIFASLLAGLEPEQAELWRGYQAQAVADLQAARTHWSRAGAAGRVLLAALEQGRRIATGTGFSPTASRLTAWARWLQSLPGSHVWRRAPELVQGHAGLARLYSPSLDQHIELYRAQANRPLRLHVQGPLRLRFDIRPVHHKDETPGIPLQGWLRVREGQRHWVAPISNNLANAELHWPQADGLLPGSRLQAELRLGPGAHELSLDGGDRDLLLQVYAEQPLLPLSVLPEGLPRPAPLVASTAGGPAVHCTVVPASVLRDCRYGAAGDESPGGAGDAISEEVRAGVAPMAGGGLAVRRPAPLPPLVSLGSQQQDRAGVDADDWGDYRRMVALLWELERRDTDTEAYLARLLTFSREQAHRLDIRRLLARALRYSGWSLIGYVPESAGVRYVRRPAARPASPSLRARLALMGDSCAGDRLLGDDELVYAMFNTRPVTLGLELRRCEPPYARPGALRVSLDDGSGAPSRDLELAPTQRRLQQRIRIPAGNQRIRIHIADRLANQFLAVRIIDPGQAGEAGASEQAFQVARRDEPVRFDVQGPAWLRIDELRDGRLHSQYLPVADGWQRVELKPAPGRRESLYRIWRRVPRQPTALVRLRTSQVVMSAVPGPLMRLPDSTAGSAALLPREDDYPLGGQKDGSLNLGFGLTSRTRVDDESGASGRLRENFAEFRAEYRYFDPLRRRYWKGEGFVRAREFGGPTLGLGGHVYMTPWADRPWLHVSGHLGGLVQHPGDTLPGANGRSEWIVNTSVRVLAHQDLGPRAWHEPSLSLFGRMLSLQRNNRYSGKALDRDVFSRYKAQHQRGLRLSDTLSWRPWLDTEWFLRAGLASNEDFNPFSPDNVSGRIGWRQLFGPVDAEARLRVQHFLADGDRGRSSTRRDLDLQLNWMAWPWMQQRLALGLRFTHNLNRADNSFVLSLSWQGGNGRGYRDFRRSEIAFYELRRRDIPERGNRLPRQEGRP